MKSLKHLLLILMFLVSCTFLAQKPEQQKMIDKATKMRDSFMACITLEDALKQAEAQKKRRELDKKTNTKKSVTPQTPKIKDQYWQNTLTSDNNKKFTDWKNGAVDLVYNYAYDSRNDKLLNVKVGTIAADGTIVLQPTEKVPNLKPLNNFKNSNNFYDIHNTDVYQYTNETAGFKLNSYLLVYKNEQKIGTLTIGDSEKVTLNLLTSGDLYFGDEGYILSWVYVDKDCAIKATENWQGDLSNTGTPLQVETTVTYNLNFKTGWNLVKTEVIGTYKFPNAAEEYRSRYKKHEHTMLNSIPTDATYYFRSSVNN